jgi:hypothetical protein
MAQAAKSQDPSMEEILASIRRIIAEDDQEKGLQRPAESATEVEPPRVPRAVAASAGHADQTDSEMPPSQSASRMPVPEPIAESVKAPRTSTILDLAETMMSPGNRSAEPAVDADLTPARYSRPDSAAGSEPAFNDADTPSATSSPEQSETTRGEEGGALMSGVTSTAVDSAFNALAQTVLVQNARTLEDLVREMLRPMLKVWLDDNLPGLVERLVRAEIERVSRGRSG